VTESTSYPKGISRYCLYYGGLFEGKDKLMQNWWLTGKSRAKRREWIAAERPHTERENAGKLMNGDGDLINTKC